MPLSPLTGIFSVLRSIRLTASLARASIDCGGGAYEQLHPGWLCMAAMIARCARVPPRAMPSRNTAHRGARGFCTVGTKAMYNRFKTCTCKVLGDVHLRA